MDANHALLADYEPPATHLLHSLTAPAAAAQQSSQQQSSRPLVLSLADISKEAALFKAAAMLANKLPGLEVMRHAVAPDYVLDQLLSQGLFEAAVELVHELWSAGALEDHLQRVVVAMATQCVRLQVQQSGALGIQLANNLHSHCCLVCPDASVCMEPCCGFCYCQRHGGSMSQMHGSVQ